MRKKKYVSKKLAALREQQVEKIKARKLAKVKAWKDEQAKKTEAMKKLRAQWAQSAQDVALWRQTFTQALAGGAVVDVAEQMADLAVGRRPKNCGRRAA